MNELKQITQSKYFKTFFVMLGFLIVAGVIFETGVKVGERRAKYSYQWGANYERNFVGSGRMANGRGGFENGRENGGFGMMGNFDRSNFRNGHGLAGKIVSITDNNIVVKDPSGKENTIAVSDKTLIKNGQMDLKITDLKNDDKLVIVGRPSENGVVNADLIRVFDKE